MHGKRAILKRFRKLLLPSLPEGMRKTLCCRRFFRLRLEFQQHIQALNRASHCDVSNVERIQLRTTNLLFTNGVQWRVLQIRITQQGCWQTILRSIQQHRQFILEFGEIRVDDGCNHHRKGEAFRFVRRHDLYRIVASTDANAAFVAFSIPPIQKCAHRSVALNAQLLSCFEHSLRVRREHPTPTQGFKAMANHSRQRLRCMLLHLQQRCDGLHEIRRLQFMLDKRTAF